MCVANFCSIILFLTVESCAGPVPCMDAVFVLDISISINNDDNFNLMKNIVTSTFPVVNVSAECSHAAVILFAREATIRFNLNEYTDETSLKKAVDEIVYSGIDEEVRNGTNTPAALDLLRIAGSNGSLGLRDDILHIGVVITDGRPNLKHKNVGNGKKRTKIAGNKLHKKKIYNQIYAIGIEGKRPLGNTLRLIADPKELVFSIAGFKKGQFTQLRENITRELCNRK